MMKSITNKKLTILYALTVLLIAPNFAYAWSFESIAGKVISLMEILFAAAAVVYFLWYGIMFLSAAGDGSKTATARQGVLWGVVGVVVGAVALGIINAVANFFLS